MFKDNAVHNAKDLNYCMNYLSPIVNRPGNITLLLLATVLLFSVSAPVQAERKGYVSYQACPHSCRTLGIPKTDCRDWREGELCYVEDLRRAPLAAPSTTPLPRPTYGIGRPLTSPRYPPPSQVRPVPRPVPETIDPGYQRDRVECERLDRRYIAPPRINIERVKKSGNLFADKVRVYGSVEGVCLVEAGLFEYSKPEEPIRLVTSPEFRRFEFSLQTSRGREPEIRVYNINGDRDIVPLFEDDPYQDSGRDPYYQDPYYDRNDNGRGW